MQKNTSGKWVVFAFNRTTNVALTGDAGNITANIRIDGGAANAVDDANPTELEDGYYIFDITAAEANGDNLLLTAQSTTSDIQVVACPPAVWTRPPNFEVLGIESGGAISTLNGHTAQTGDSFARIGVAGAGLTNINLPDQTMDITGNLSGSVGSVTGAVGSVTGAVGSVTGAVGSVAGNVDGSAASVVGAVGSVTGAVGSVAGNVDGSVGSLGATAKTEVNAEVVDALNVDTYGEPGQGTPAAASSLVTKIGYLYKSWRNRSTQSATTYSLYNDDAITVDQKATVSDDTVTADKGEVATGP